MVELTSSSPLRRPVDATRPVTRIRRSLYCLCCILGALSTVTLAQSTLGRIDPQHTPVLHPHLDLELTFDKPTDPGRWDRESPGLHAGFGSTDEIYFRSEVPALGENVSLWTGTGWRGER